ncbi:MAG: S-layer homology domain-containing protein [Firmicutes bacterium]|nr:S-layer homology domain-containing protein [Bacillota bacterium]
MKRRIMSLLLCVVMVCALFPMRINAIQQICGVCGSCGGSGKTSFSAKCNGCGGDGRITCCAVCGSENIITIVTGYGSYTGCGACKSASIITKSCSRCGGSGSTSYTMTCSTCGGSGYVSDHTHSYSSVVTAPTCVTGGYTTYSCSCGDSYIADYVSAIGHNYVNGVCTRCGENGSFFYLTNTFCDGERVIIYNPGFGVAMSAETVESNFKAGVAIAPEDGVIATGNLDLVWTVEETDGGYYLIDNNGNYLATSVNYSLPVDGEYRIWNTGKAKSTDCVYLRNDRNYYLEWYEKYNDFTAYADSSDNEGRFALQIYTTQEQCKHTYEAVETPPTCSQQGYTTHTCSLCGESYIDNYVAALDHNWDEGTVTLPPTATEDGIMTYCCTRCDETKTAAIPVTGEGCTHSYAIDIVPPSCLQEGYAAYICTLCGDSYSVPYADALGHDWVSEVIKDAANNLLIIYRCRRCAKTDTEIIPATGEEDKPCNGGEACPSNPFTDVEGTGHWTHAGIDFAISHGLFSGMSATTFEPDTAMTRSMLVTVLWRYADMPIEGRNSFTDVPYGTWYTDAVSWAMYNGVVTGVGNNKFNPDGKITREQMATILYRYAKSSGIDTSKRANLSSFPDSGKISSYAKEALQWAVAEGLINGSDGKLLPQGNATRAQVAAILMRFIQNVVK